MSKYNFADFDGDRTDCELVAIKAICRKYPELLDEIYDKILKRAQKTPYKNWLKISPEKYSLDEMRAIYFVFIKWLGFNFSFTKPIDILKIVSTYSVTISPEITVNNYSPVGVKEYYICWFKD